MSLRLHPKKGEWTLHPRGNERADREIAAHYITERFPVVSDTISVGEVHTYITQFAREFEAIDYIYVVNSADKLVGVLSMRDIFSHAKKMDVRNVMQREIVTITPETRRERIARLALEYNLRSIPVVQNKKLVGVVQTHKILHTINRSLKEHLLTLSGVQHEHLEYDNTLQIPVFQSLIHRLPWLVIGLFGVIIAAGIIDRFEAVLDTHIIIAFFIPAIVYMSDALGTQNQTLLIRDLATMGKELKLLPYFLKTMAIGLIISGLIGLLVYVITILIWQDAATAFVIALAMAATLLISAATSILTTLLFKYMKQDPALGSGPFATIVSDLTSIIIYFVIVSALL